MSDSYLSEYRAAYCDDEDQAIPEAPTAPHVPGESDPEWRHWAKAEIQRLTEEANDADVLNRFGESVEAYWKDRALTDEKAYDAVSAERNEALELAGRLSRELAEQSVTTVEWGLMVRGHVRAAVDEADARNLLLDSYGPARVVSRKVGPWVACHADVLLDIANRGEAQP